MDLDRRTTLAALGGLGAAAMLGGATPALAQGRRLGSPTKAFYWVATITPCNRNLQFDPGAMAAIMQWHKECGADGVTVLGTSGEFPSFSVAERKAILETAMKHRNGMNIIVNPGTSNIAETIDLARHAEGLGVDGFLVIPPFYFNAPPVAGLTNYYSMLFDAVSTPINLYHIPGTSEVPISIELLKALHHYPHLAGIKDSSGNAPGYAEFIRNFPDLNMRTGGADLLETALDNGMGAILAEGNSFSKLCANVFHTYRAKGDWKPAAQKLNAVIGSVMKTEGGDAIYSYPHMKYLLSLDMGGGDWYPRLPYPPLSDAKKASLKTAYQRAKAMI
ncbi:dihydrodipicolinate synthase family protein [Sphingomonas quercus]|uniref:Dihydrodipicolinate synthase family protein n=1 Tax=Sphingomonas quercus TaxID=2842451 RepID=A0ABS6BF43_9SPHN|nr:dihydrodipicolinate synthase family protein [Sphingomonas quercus]MBU3076789.1 dihydrodipicolinate synthase family protein [Sphingomonas quercus]